MNLLFLAAGLAAQLPQTLPADPQPTPEPVPSVRQAGREPSVAAQEAPSLSSPNAAAPETSATSAVSSYPASFFAAAQPNSARDMIARVPGFTFDDGAAARGFDAAAGNVLIDGQLPTSKSDDLESVLRRLPASQVARIDLIRGGAPGIDMHGKTLVANIIRKSGSSNTGNIQLNDRWVTSDGRQAPSIRIEATRQAGDRTFEGSLAYGRFVDESLGTGQVIQTGPDHVLQGIASDDTRAGGSQAAVTGAFSTPLSGGKFRINVSLKHQAYDADEIVGDQGIPAINPSSEHDAQAITLSELGLHYTRDLGTKFGLEVLAIQQLDGESATTLYSAPGDLEAFREHHTNGESIGRATLTWRGSSHLTIETGAEATFNWLHSHTAYADNGNPVIVPAANVEVTERRGEAFAKATWTPSTQLNVEAGLREEVSRIASSGDVVLSKTLQFPKPSLVVAWTPASGNQVRVRLEREVSQLDFNDFVAAASLSTGQILAGNPNLTPQQDWVVEAAFERRLLGDGSATFTLRHLAYNDVIDRAPVISATGDFDTPANIGNGHDDEAVVDLDLPLGRLGIADGLLKTNLTWRASSVRDPTTGQQRPISGLRPFEGTIEFSQDLPKHKLTWGVQVDVGWSQTYFRFDQIETDSMPVQGRVYIEARPWNRWSVRAEISDIGGGSGRRLTNWPGLRMVGVSYENQDVRKLSLGPVLRFRVRRDW